MSHSTKEYLPIVFTDLQISTKIQPDNSYIEEKFPIIKQLHHSTSQPKISKVTSPSKTQQEILNYQKQIKKIVFPNILQRTKQDIKKYRQHQLSLISDEISISQPVIELEHKKVTKPNSQSPLKLHSSQPSFTVQFYYYQLNIKHKFLLYQQLPNKNRSFFINIRQQFGILFK